MIGGAMRYKYPPGKERRRPQPQPKMKRPAKLPSLESKKMKPQASEPSVQDDAANLQEPRRLHGRPGLTTKEWQQLSENIRTNLPKLSDRDVRRREIPYHHAVLMELMEDGFMDSFSFLQEMFKLNEVIYNEFDENSLSLQSALLRENPVCLDRLREGLQEAEMAKYKGNTRQEISNLMNTAIFFMQKTEDWWWLARETFEKCIKVSSNYRGDGGKGEALVRFMYGIFVYEKADNFEEARRQLEVVRQLSNGKKWRANEVSAESNDTLFRETNKYLYIILLKQAIEVRDRDPRLSARLGLLSVRRAAGSSEVDAPSQVLYEVASSFLAAKEYRMALNVFEVYLQVNGATSDCKSVAFADRTCDAVRNMGICYTRINEMDKAHESYKNQLKVAEVAGSPSLVPDAHRHLGEFLLHMDLPADAALHLTKSFKLYNELEEDDKQHEKELSRILLSIATGHGKLPNYTKALLQEGDLMPIVNWKSRRIPYWYEEEVEVGSENEDTENPQSEESETSDSTDSLDNLSS